MDDETYQSKWVMRTVSYESRILEMGVECAFYDLGRINALKHLNWARVSDVMATLMSLQSLRGAVREFFNEWTAYYLCVVCS